MFITTVIKVSTLLKVIFFIVLALVIIRYIKNIKTSIVGGKKNINYLLRRNTKSFLKNRYSMFNIHNSRNEDAKVYNINSDEDVIRYANGDIYKGQIKNGMREGLGTCYFANKDVYEGMWKDDKMECVGKYIFADKSFYSGDAKKV